MANKIIVQDGRVIYATSDPTRDVAMDVAGHLNVTKQVTVGDDPLAAGLIQTPPDSGVDLIFRSNTDTISFGNIRLEPVTNGNIILNNVIWPTGSITPVPGMYLGVTALNTLEFLVLPSSSGLPDQTGNNGNYLTTDGTTASWAPVAAGGGATTQAFTLKFGPELIDGTDMNPAWFDELYTVANPEVTISGNNFVFTNGGTFNVAVSGYIENDNGIEGISLWYDGLVTFGVEMHPQDDGYEITDFTKPVHSTFGESDSQNSFEVGPKFARTNISFSDNFIWQSPANNKFNLTGWAISNTLGDSEEANIYITVRITKLSDENGV